MDNIRKKGFKCMFFISKIKSYVFQFKGFRLTKKTRFQGQGKIIYYHF
jgi:hypothetical protein